MNIKQKIEQDLANIYLGNLYTVEANLDLPQKGQNGTLFTWETEFEHLIDCQGHVTRPRHGTGDRTVRLTVTGQLAGELKTRIFDVTVLERDSSVSIKEALVSRFQVKRNQLANLPQYAVVIDSNDKLSIQAVRWRIPFATLNELPETFEIQGTPCQLKEGNILEPNHELKYKAIITLINEDQPKPAADEVVQSDLEEKQYCAKLRPLPLKTVHLEEGRLAKNRDLMETYLLQVDPDRILYNFRKTAGLSLKNAEPMTGWDAPESKLRGHTSGHYLSGLAYAMAGASDERKKQQFYDRINYLISEMAIAQDEISKKGLANYGFFSAYSEEQFDLLEEYIPYPRIWAPYYTLHKLIAGLLDCYEFAGSDQALSICRKIIIWLSRRFDKLSRHALQKMWSIYIAGEYGGMNEVVARYIHLTGEEEYVWLAKCFDNDKLFYPLEQNIDALNNLHANQHIPQVVGALSIYRVTGESRYLKIADHFWQIATENHTYSIGGIGEGEMFRPSRTISQYLTDKAAEGCASYNMLKLTKDLFQYRAESTMMDYYERTLLNHIAASLEPDEPTGGSTYFMPLAPASKLGFDRHENSCCHGTGMENHVRAQEAFYYYQPATPGANHDTLFVNMYQMSSINWPEKNIEIRQTSHFMKEQSATFVFDQAVSLKLCMRIPAWLKRAPIVTLNGLKIKTSAPGTWLTLENHFKVGDVLHLDMPFSLRYETACDNSSVFSIFYGPYVMAAASEEKEMLTLPDYDMFKTEAVLNKDDTTLTWRDLIFKPHCYTGDHAYHIYFRKTEA